MTWGWVRAWLSRSGARMKQQTWSLTKLLRWNERLIEKNDEHNWWKKIKELVMKIRCESKWKREKLTVYHTTSTAATTKISSDLATLKTKTGLIMNTSLTSQTDHAFRPEVTHAWRICCTRCHIPWNNDNAVPSEMTQHVWPSVSSLYDSMRPLSHIHKFRIRIFWLRKCVKSY